MANDFLWFLGGVAAACLYLAVLWTSVVLFVRCGSSSAMIGGMIVRLGLLGGFAFGAVHVVPELRELALGIAGFLLARVVTLKSLALWENLRGNERQGQV